MTEQLLRGPHVEAGLQLMSEKSSSNFPSGYSQPYCIKS